MDSIFLSILISFVISTIIAPLIIYVIKILKANQNILHYVKSHKQKQGTPTMGGFIFILGILLSSLILFGYNSSLGYLTLSVTLGYSVIGFLDDYTKIIKKENEGLLPYQKIIAQVLIAIIIAVFAYNSPLIGSEILVPFTNNTIDLGIFYIPFIIFLFLAVTNSVNLTDGLDGLAGGVSLVYLISFTILTYLLVNNLIFDGVGIGYIEEYQNILIVCGSTIGALLAYLIFNSHPANIFMGDTGSLALGGLISILAIFTRQVLLIPILGLFFVFSAVSVIIQVLYYKKTKKRIFKMAPLHHHFEKKGVNETKIVSIYIIASAMLGVLSIVLTILI